MSHTETDRLYETLAILKPRRSEAAMQDAIHRALTRGRFIFTREHHHDEFNRFDFYVTTAANEHTIIEVKVKGAKGPDTERQLVRYATLGVCNRIIVVTTMPHPLRISHVQVGERRIPINIINLAMNAIA